MQVFLVLEEKDCRRQQHSNRLGLLSQIQSPDILYFPRQIFLPSISVGSWDFFTFRIFLGARCSNSDNLLFPLFPVVVSFLFTTVTLTVVSRNGFALYLLGSQQYRHILLPGMYLSILFNSFRRVAFPVHQKRALQ